MNPLTHRQGMTMEIYISKENKRSGARLENEGLSVDSYSTNPLSRCWQLCEYRQAVDRLVAFVDGVLNTDQMPFRIEVEGQRRRAVAINGDGSLASFLKGFVSLIDIYEPDWRYSPDLQLFFDCFLRHPEFDCWPSCFPERTVRNERIAAEVYNDFVAELRHEGRVSGVRRKLRAWRSGLVAQERSIRKKLWLATNGRKRLIPLRLDWQFVETAAVVGDALQRQHWQVDNNGEWMRQPRCYPGDDWRPEARPRIDTGLAMSYRELFFDNQRGADAALFEPMVMYATKMENGGRHRANHFHTLFLFDADKVTLSDLDVLKIRATDRWHRVTGGLGLTFDSRDRRDVDYLRRCGRWALDPIDCSDREQFEKLVKYFVDYCTEDKDQQIRVKPTKGARTMTLGRGTPKATD